MWTVFNCATNRALSPERVKQATKGRSRINNVCLLTGGIIYDSMVEWKEVTFRLLVTCESEDDFCRSE